MKNLWLVLLLASSCMMMGCAEYEGSAMPEHESWENAPSASSFQQLPRSQRRVYLGDE